MFEVSLHLISNVTNFEYFKLMHIISDILNKRAKGECFVHLIVFTYKDFIVHYSKH